MVCVNVLKKRTNTAANAFAQDVEHTACVISLIEFQREVHICFTSSWMNYVRYM